MVAGLNTQFNGYFPRKSPTSCCVCRVKHNAAEEAHVVRGRAGELAQPNEWVQNCLLFGSGALAGRKNLRGGTKRIARRA